MLFLYHSPSSTFSEFTPSDPALKQEIEVPNGEIGAADGGGCGARRAPDGGADDDVASNGAICVANGAGCGAGRVADGGAHDGVVYGVPGTSFNASIDFGQH